MLPRSGHTAWHEPVVLFSSSASTAGDWTMRAFRGEAIEKIHRQVGTGRVICGLSGGVDSAVAAVLIAVLLPVKTVGVMGDGLTYDYVSACAP